MIIKINPAKVITEGNLRCSDADVDQMVSDLLSVGRQLHPVGVVKCPSTGQYRVVFGFRRTEAIREIVRRNLVPAGHPLRNLLAVVLPEDIDTLQAQIAENSHRVNYSPIEEAQIIDTLIQRKIPAKRIAEMFGRSPGWVSQRHGLLRLPGEVREMIPGWITPYEGYLLSQLAPQEAILRARAISLRREQESRLGAIAPQEKASQSEPRNEKRKRNSAPRVEGHFSRARVLRDLSESAARLPKSSEERQVVQLVVSLLRGECSAEDFISTLHRLL